MSLCKWPDCSVQETATYRSVRTGVEREYCDGHAPDTDGEKWEEA